LLKPTNIEDKLRFRRGEIPHSNSIMEQVNHIFNTEAEKENTIKERLYQENQASSNALNFDDLDVDKIYHINTIKAICIDYRLRFLNSNLFKNEFPSEVLSSVKTIEKTHRIKLKGFKIMAPSKLFKLKNPDDPLLFVPLGHGYYYLIHKWGNDLHPLRKWGMWPYKNFDTLITSALVFSFLLTFLFHYKMLKSQVLSSQFLIMFLFMFKSVIGVIIFYAFSQGKNFSSVIWNSQNCK